MKFALAVPGLLNYPAAMAPWEPKANGADILRFAQHADAQRWEWLTIPEHIFMPSEMAEHMGARFPEGISACAVLAGATRRINMLTYVLVVPYRHPLMLAKQISTLDWLSGGRFTLGAAPGHLQGEFDALGVPFRERGKMIDEYLDAMIECWTADSPHFNGDYVNFSDIAFEPKPASKPHVPIFVGGNIEASMRRAARVGDGWIPWLITAEQLPSALEFLRRQPGFEEKADRFEIVLTSTEYQVEDYSHAETGETQIETNRDRILFGLEALQKAGATVAQVMTPRVETLDQCLDWVSWYNDDIIPKFS